MNSAKSKKLLSGIFLVYQVYSAFSLVQSREHVSAFVVAMSLVVCCSVVGFSNSIHLWLRNTELCQYDDLLKRGVPVNGKIVFSGNSTNQDGLFQIEGQLRYRLKENCVGIKEITKETTTTRTYEPKAGAIESVNLAVLPGYPKSGVEISHAKIETNRIRKEMIKHRRYLAVSLILILPLWPWTIQKAREENRLPYLFLTSIFVALGTLTGMVAVALKIKPMSKRYWIIIPLLVAVWSPARMGILRMRMGRHASPRRFVPVGIYVAGLLYTIVKYVWPSRTGIVSPSKDVTISDVCENDYDPDLVPVALLASHKLMARTACHSTS